MNHNEQWKNDVLNSLDGIQRAIPDEILLSQIMARLPENTLTTHMSQWQLRWAGAAACLLVVLNLYVLNVDGVDGKAQQANSASTDTPALRPSSAGDITLFTDYSLYQSVE